MDAPEDGCRALEFAFVFAFVFAFELFAFEFFCPCLRICS